MTSWVSLCTEFSLAERMHCPLMPFFPLHQQSATLESLSPWNATCWRIHSLKTDNSTFERVEEFKYLGTTLTNQNSNAEEIKGRFRSGNACYHSVQNLFSSRLLSKNLKIKIYRTITLPVVLYGCETWSLKRSWGCLRIWCRGEYLDLGGTR
jgi:hypothetical protein